MDRVVVRVMATEFARVSTSYGTHGSHVDIPFGSVRAHGSAQSPLWVYGYATKHTDGGSDEIVKARVTTWDANLDHLLSDHSGWGADSALKMEVEPRIVT